ncbi:MAG: roadblock/LC7 domain-containing protein [Halobacteriota archaeon]
MKESKLVLTLKALVEIEGVNASAVVTKDGIKVKVLSHYTLEAVSALPAMVAMMMKIAEKCTRMFKTGDMEELIVKANDGMLLAERCSEEFVFIIAVDKSVDLDSIKSEREKVKAAIREA